MYVVPSLDSEVFASVLKQAGLVSEWNQEQGIKAG